MNDTGDISTEKNRNMGYCDLLPPPPLLPAPQQFYHPNETSRIKMFRKACINVGSFLISSQLEADRPAEVAYWTTECDLTVVSRHFLPVFAMSREKLTLISLVIV